MKILTRNQIDSVSGGDEADAFIIGLAIGHIVGKMLDAIMSAQPDGTQMGDIQGP